MVTTIVFSFFSRSVATVLASFLMAVNAAAFDMRSCRLDQLTFVDPWSLAQFVPNRVGVNFYFACGEREDIVHGRTNPGGCNGPYGDVLLEGVFSDNGRETSLLAVYSYHKSTSPCCGWSVFAVGESPEIEAHADWLAFGEAPALSKWPFASIHNSWGTRDDMNGVAALICAPDIG